MKKQKINVVPSVLYHISKGYTDIVEFQPCTHFGTYQSAIDRSKSKAVNSL